MEEDRIERIKLKLDELISSVKLPKLTIKMYSVNADDLQDQTFKNKDIDDLYKYEEVSNKNKEYPFIYTVSASIEDYSNKKGHFLKTGNLVYYTSGSKMRCFSSKIADSLDTPIAVYDLNSHSTAFNSDLVEKLDSEDLKRLISNIYEINYIAMTLATHQP